MGGILFALKVTKDPNIKEAHNHITCLLHWPWAQPIILSYHVSTTLEGMTSSISHGGDEWIKEER